MKKCYIINDKNDSIILNYIFINKLLMLRYLNFKKFEIICGEKYESKEKLKKIVNLIKLIIPDSYIIINSKSNEIINIDKIDEINLISKEDINKNNINKFINL